MILLERKVPNKLLFANALVRRLDKNHEYFDYYVNLSNRLQAGYKGELFVDRQLIEITHPEKHFLLFNYECINEFGFSHQIDTLLLTPEFLLIIEIKNISGRVDYDEDKHQLTRTLIDATESFTNPFTQVKRHGQYFFRLLKRLKISLPIEYAIVCSNPSTIIGTIPKHPPFFHASGLQFYLNKLEAKHKSVVTHSKLIELSKYLISNLKRQEVKNNIDPSNIKKGVLCEMCNYKFQMHYKAGFWCCPNCGVRNKNAILQSLDDYRLLVNKYITNQEFRDFFGVDSMQVISKLLARLGLTSEGEKRGRRYIIPENIVERGPF
ncbi:nuclease-like protein [Ureibacillus xyleni]|uniref:Nuclease-like protein n=1 Tax=Ureibacillus xyleni TaxID=614648 RepID=A0A285SYU1_9BACL|nr:nuclease-related domain-containing protein [Ureibacillus xyleni]SOC13538.1 nuclease-like protein [Ureibacillus xyleni]